MILHHRHRQSIITLLFFLVNLQCFTIKFVLAEDHYVKNNSFPIRICEEVKLRECTKPHNPNHIPILITRSSLSTTKVTKDPGVWTTTLSPTTTGKSRDTSHTLKYLKWTESPLNRLTGKEDVRMSLDKTNTAQQQQNRVFVQKDDKKINSWGKIFCSFDEILHSEGSHSICDQDEWSISSAKFGKRHDYLERKKRDVVMGQRAKLTSEEIRKLKLLYGDKFNEEAGERVKAMGLFNSPWRPSVYRGNDYPYYGDRSRSQHESDSRGKFLQRNGRRKPRRDRFFRDTRINYDSVYENNEQESDNELQPESSYPTREQEIMENEEEEISEEVDAEIECSLHGTWLSPWTGVAIDLRPDSNGEGVSVKLEEDLPNVKNKVLGSTWVGSVMLSPVSPTTVTLLFQEGQSSNPAMVNDNPDTVVFVGQCIECKGGTAIQGTWIIFSKRQRDCNGLIT